MSQTIAEIEKEIEDIKKSIIEDEDMIFDLTLQLEFIDKRIEEMEK